MSNWSFPAVAAPDGSVVGILSYPENLATSSARSHVRRTSCLQVGTLITFFSLSYFRSTASKYPIISSSENEVPRSPLIFSGSNGTSDGSLFSGYTSTIPPTTSPAPNSSMSSQARLTASSAVFGSRPLSNFWEASVCRPIRLEERRMFVPLKQAASKRTVFTSSVIMEFSPPMMPPMPTGFSASQIMMTS